MGPDHRTIKRYKYFGKLIGALVEGKTQCKKSEVGLSPKLCRESTLFCPLDTTDHEIKISAIYNEIREVRLLVDTGAQVSFIKEEIVKKEEVCRSEKQKIRGVISKISGETLGTVEANLTINNERFKHKFHVVNDQFSVGNEGILGSDFLNSYNGCIDYETRILSLRISNDNSSLVKNFEQIGSTKTYFRRFENKNSIRLDGRTQNIIELATESKEDLVVRKKELTNGIYMANCIVKPNKGFIRVAILNTNQEDFYLEKDKLTIETERLSDFNIIERNINAETLNKRHNDIEESLDLSHCNEEEK